MPRCRRSRCKLWPTHRETGAAETDGADEHREAHAHRRSGAPARRVPGPGGEVGHGNDGLASCRGQRSILLGMVKPHSTALSQTQARQRWKELLQIIALPVGGDAYGCLQVGQRSGKVVIARAFRWVVGSVPVPRLERRRDRAVRRLGSRVQVGQAGYAVDPHGRCPTPPRTSTPCRGRRSRRGDDDAPARPAPRPPSPPSRHSSTSTGEATPLPAEPGDFGQSPRPALRRGLQGTPRREPRPPRRPPMPRRAVLARLGLRVAEEPS
jgi:hypothetical protein